MVATEGIGRVKQPSRPTPGLTDTTQVLKKRRNVRQSVNTVVIFETFSEVHGKKHK